MLADCGRSERVIIPGGVLNFSLKVKRLSSMDEIIVIQVWIKWIYNHWPLPAPTCIMMLRLCVWLWLLKFREWMCPEILCGMHTNTHSMCLCMWKEGRMFCILLVVLILFKSDRVAPHKCVINYFIPCVIFLTKSMR